jgi:hypothetical protein
MFAQRQCPASLGDIRMTPSEKKEKRLDISYDTCYARALQVGEDGVA